MKFAKCSLFLFEVACRRCRRTISLWICDRSEDTLMRVVWMMLASNGDGVWFVSARFGTMEVGTAGFRILNRLMSSLGEGLWFVRLQLVASAAITKGQQ